MHGRGHACNRRQPNVVYTFAMPSVITLSYARTARRWTARRIVLVVLTVLVCLGGSGLGYFGYDDVRRRMAKLDANPVIGPVDWGSVVASPILLKLAWQLSSKQRLGSAPHYLLLMGLFLRTEDTLDETRLLGPQMNGIEFELMHPLAYGNGKLELTVLIHNRSEESVVVPPFKPVTGFFCGYAFQGLQYVWQRGTYPFLGKGVRVLGPGETLRQEFRLDASSQPGPSVLLLELPGRIVCINIGVRDRFVSDPFRGLRLPYDKWSSIPKEIVNVRAP